MAQTALGNGGVLSRGKGSLSGLCKGLPTLPAGSPCLLGTCNPGAPQRPQHKGWALEGPPSCPWASCFKTPQDPLSSVPQPPQAQPRNRVQPSSLARLGRTGSHCCVSDLILADTGLMAPLAATPFSPSRALLKGHQIIDRRQEAPTCQIRPELWPH